MNSALAARTNVARSGSSIVSPLLNGNAVPWHGNGKTLLKSHLSIDKALTACGVNQQVGIRPACMVVNDAVVEIPEAKVIYFKDTNKPIKVVGNRYKVIQNADAFDWFAPFIESKQASIQVAGGLKEDNIIWMLAETNIPEVEIVAGDKVKFYIHLSHSHDGTISINANFIPVRMTNMSFLAMDRNMPSTSIMKVKHTVSTRIDTEVLKTVMSNASNDLAALTTRYKKFAKRLFTDTEALEYFKKVIAVKGEEKDIAKTLDNLMFIYKQGEYASVAGNTLWGAFCAVTEFNSWYRGRTTDTRLQSLWYGQYGETNIKALEVATAMVK